MKIIAVEGPASRGKSTSICLAQNQYVANARNAGQNVIIQQGTCYGKDIRIAVTANNRKVAFCSGGDDGFAITDNIQFALLMNCDVLVTAVRTRGSSSVALWGYCLNSINCEMKVIAPVSCHDFFGQQVCNIQNANQLTAGFILLAI